jgi:hypothetical protein
MNAHTSRGELLKRDALALLEATRETVILRARRIFVAHLLEHGEATADAARHGLDLRGINPVALGCVPGPLARAGIIRKVGFEQSTRSEAHARPVALCGFFGIAQRRCHGKPRTLNPR